MASAHGQAEYETNAEADSESGKRVTLNCIAGFLYRVGRRVLSAVVLTARHVPYAVTQILDILSDLSNSDDRSLWLANFLCSLCASNVGHGVLHCR